MCERKKVQRRQVCHGKKIRVNFDVANAISGADVKCAGRDYSAMLPYVCCLFTCHIETIKQN